MAGLHRGIRDDRQQNSHYQIYRHGQLHIFDRLIDFDDGKEAKKEGDRELHHNFRKAKKLWRYYIPTADQWFGLKIKRQRPQFQLLLQ
jgi:hypothetical protein